MEKDLVVVNLLPGTPAESYLQKGDCITKVDGQEVNKHNVIDMLIGDDKPGTFVKVGYTRNDGPVCTWHARAAVMLLACAPLLPGGGFSRSHVLCCRWPLTCMRALSFSASRSKRAWSCGCLLQSWGIGGDSLSCSLRSGTSLSWRQRQVCTLACHCLLRHRQVMKQALMAGGLWGEITSVMKVDESKDSAALVDEV